MSKFLICKEKGNAIQLANELWECRKKEPCILKHRFENHTFCKEPICEAIIEKKVKP